MALSKYRINVGCGMTLTEGWLNFDNSPSVRLAAFPAVWKMLGGIGIISPAQRSYIEFCARHQVVYANAVRRIPLANGSVEVIYSSHMLEHLSQSEAVGFLREALRVLQPGGIIRLALPDLAMAVDAYRRDGDADAFMDGLLVAAPPLSSLKDRLRLLLSGYRHHQWMYDGNSLKALVERNGFAGAVIQPPGQTMIGDPGTLDLQERSDQSVYVEARKPG